IRHRDNSQVRQRIEGLQGEITLNSQSAAVVHVDGAVIVHGAGGTDCDGAPLLNLKFAKRAERQAAVNVHFRRYTVRPGYCDLASIIEASRFAFRHSAVNVEHAIGVPTTANFDGDAVINSQRAFLFDRHQPLDVQYPGGAHADHAAVVQETEATNYND